MAIMDMGNGNYRYETNIGVGKDNNIDKDVQMFRRVLEAMSGEPVDVTSDRDAFCGGTMVRVYFRHSGVYSQVDLGQARYGGNMLEELARMCIKQKQDYQKGRIQDAYMGKEMFPTRGTSSPPPRKNEVTAALNGYRETNRHAVIAEQNSYDNPLRVELQKKVDAWLK